MHKFKLFLGILAACFCINVLPQNVTAAEVPASTPKENTAIQPVSLVTGEEDTTTFQSYDLVVPVSTKTLVVPINMDYKGLLSIKLTGKVIPSGLDVALYSDEACTSIIGYARYLSSSSMESDLEAKVPAKGTYYLKLSLSSYAEADASLTITPYSFSSENKTLKNKEWIGSYPMSYDSQISHKITINKPGYIMVEGASLGEYSSSISVTLLNSKKAKLSELEYLSKTQGYATYFAVNKGTYYINAKSSDVYKLRYSFVAVAEKPGSTKAKAVTIGKGKTVKGLVQATDSTTKADWYKVKLTSKRKLAFDIYAKSNESIKFEIIPASKNVILWGSTITLYDFEGGEYSTKETMPVGTYYIKVTKRAKTSSGYYTIKFR